MRAFDEAYRAKGYQVLCGVDEAGRGPLAGPVVAGAVVFHAETRIDGVNDSKKLSEKQREKLFARIVAEAYSYSFAVVSPERIDEINILQASLEAMKIAVAGLTVKPDFILIDGNKVFNDSIPREAVVKGDGKSFSIAAASIIAKVTRDRLLLALDKEYPEYGWAKNKGYPTKDHIKAVLEHGPCPYHRKTFLRNLPKWEQRDLFEQ